MYYIRLFALSFRACIDQNNINYISTDIYRKNIELLEFLDKKTVRKYANEDTLLFGQPKSFYMFACVYINYLY